MSLFYRFPKIYDYITHKLFNYDQESLYIQQIDNMLALEELKENALILDLACGSAELTLQLAKERPDCKVIGVDISEKMVASASEKAQEQGLENVYFICKSALELSPTDLQACCDMLGSESAPFDLITCSYGFSAMPNNYEQIFRHTKKLLASGGWYVITDVYYPKITWLTTFMTKIIDPLLWGANPLRKPFLLMQEELADFAIYESPTTYYGFLPVVEYVAKGIKK